jgi:eukaryotic-like serine/threonine-protein kinase
MPHPAPLRSGDPRRVGRYQLAGRLEGIPSDDPIFIGAGRDGTDVAITVLGGDWALDGAARDRFTAEAAVARRVPPFCAARVLDAGLDGRQAYLVSEYISGWSLLELVSAEGVRRGHDLEAVAIGMATGLASVHQAGLVHGSFGPEFVILAADGSPRVVEYGITPPYGAATPSADMLAWAQTVVFAASGHPPAMIGDLDVLPGYLREPVERCLDPEPASRPAARAVVQSLLGSHDLPAGVLAEGPGGQFGMSGPQPATTRQTALASRIMPRPRAA